jgi:hypothetical protein
MRRSEEESHKVIYARLKAKRDKIKSGIRNPRPANTPLSVSWSKRSKPRKEVA